MDSRIHKKKTLRGLKWSLFNQIIQVIIQLISSIVLARLLLPEDYGLFAMVNVIAGFAMIFTNFGLGSAIIQSKKIINKQLSTVFWVNILIGSLFTLIFYLSSSQIANFYGDERLVGVTQLLGCSFLISSIGIVHSSLLSKRMDFKIFFFISLLSSLSSLVIAISMASNEYGVYALVTQVLLAQLITVILVFFNEKWKPSLVFDLKSIADLIEFSKYFFATNVVRYWTRNIDNLLIGKFLGSSSLGIYSKSYSILMLPLSNISNVISRVIFPSFSMIQNDVNKVKSVYLNITKAIAILTFPLMTGLCVTAEVFVPVVFGQNWKEMIFVVQVLSLIAIPQSIGTLNGNLYLFAGRTKLQFRVSSIMHLIVITFIVFGLSFGLNGLVVSYAVGSIVIMYHNFKYPLALINTKFIELAKSLFPVLCYSWIMGLAVLLIHSVLETILEDSLLLFVDIISGIIIYSVLVMSFEFKFLMYLWKAVKENA